jgi:hypothetical protein
LTIIELFLHEPFIIVIFLLLLFLRIIHAVRGVGVCRELCLRLGLSSRGSSDRRVKSMGEGLIMLGIIHDIFHFQLD